MGSHSFCGPAPGQGCGLVGAVAGTEEPVPGAVAAASFRDQPGRGRFASRRSACRRVQQLPARRVPAGPDAVPDRRARRVRDRRRPGGVDQAARAARDPARGLRLRDSRRRQRDPADRRHPAAGRFAAGSRLRCSAKCSRRAATGRRIRRTSTTPTIRRAKSISRRSTISGSGIRTDTASSASITRRRDDTVRVTHGDVVAVRDGYHPFVTAYGYDAYYLNVLAGTRRSMAASDDPRYAHFRQQWPPPDPRLPLVPRP